MTIAVFDSDDFGLISNASKEYMGSFSIDLHTVSPVQEEWYNLEREEHMTSNSSQEVTGKILVHHEIQGGARKTGIDASNIEATKFSFSDAVRILHTSRSEGVHMHPAKPPRFPFDPESLAKQTWDLFIMILLLFTTFAVPYMLAFGKEADKHEPLDAYQIFDLIMDMLFCVDILLSFCTAYVWQVRKN